MIGLRLASRRFEPFRFAGFARLPGFRDFFFIDPC